MPYRQIPRMSKPWLTYAFLSLIAWLPLPLGSKLPWAISIAEIWCYLLASIVIVILIRLPHPVLPRPFKTARFALILLSLNLGWLLIQCFPLPLHLLATFSPAAAELYIYSLGAMAQAPISLDANTTFYQFQTAAFLFTLFCLTLYLINTRKKLKWLVFTVLISALFQVIYGAMMILTGMEYSFFISKAALHSHIGSATGTFTNRDHLAGYLEMALALGVGYMLSLLSSTKPAHNWKARIQQWATLLLGPKARLRLLLILLCLGLVLTHSRGGNIGFFSSLGIVGSLFLLLAYSKPRATVIFLSSLIILDIVIIGSWVGLSKVMHRLEQTSIQTEDRVDTYKATLPMIDNYLLTGIGAGNYFNAFPAYKTPKLAGYWNHAHNDYLEFLTEQGLIGFTLLAGFVLCACWIAIQTIRKRQSPFAIGLSFASLMGITALLIHSFFDYNLQILANSSMFMIIIAIAFICHDLDRKSSSDALN